MRTERINIHFIRQKDLRKNQHPSAGKNNSFNQGSKDKGLAASTAK